MTVQIRLTNNSAPPRSLRGDHDQPYAPLVVAPTMDTPERRDRFRREWLEASRTRALTVLGPPMRCLMPADVNPFPRFRPFRWLPC